MTPGPVLGTDGTIYAASGAGVLYAIDPTSGHQKWSYDSGLRGAGDLSASPLVLPSGVIVWPTPGHELVALNPDGTPAWSVDLSGRPTSPVSADGQRIYVGDSSGSVSAIDTPADRGGQPSPQDPTGRVAWTVDVGRTSYGSVVTDGSGRIYTTVDTSLVAIDDEGDAGSLAWRRDPGDGITEVSPGLGADGTVLLGTNGSREWAYRRDGSPAWNSARIITYSSPSVADDGRAYVGDHTGAVHIFDIVTGVETETVKRTSYQLWGATVVDSQHFLYFADQNGHLFATRSDGTSLFDVDLGAPIDSYAALSGDAALIVGTRAGELVSVE